ncbi:uncharacterized protein LOC125425787 [Sphaerodactylus townsendi]|uniref:uncharacterized protein LOC125425787 n=1 Tax=Sphaerodactylus townsendi TaxID=933632 RepID=UPI002026ED4D|nr:uncharacterized protein LOC125425787 [Sphaerodactylus townsendi]
MSKATTRKQSISDKAERSELETKMDQMLEMMGEMKKETNAKLEGLDNKIMNLEKSVETKLQKIETELNIMKKDLSHVKVIENAVKKLEAKSEEQDKLNVKWESKINLLEEEAERTAKQCALLELRQKRNILRIKGVPEEKDEKIEKKMITHLAKFLDMEEEMLEEDIIRIIRLSPKGHDEFKKNRDVLIFFSRLQTRDELLRKNSKEKLKIDSRDIIILKEIPIWILNRRRSYNPLINFLREKDITFRWEEVEGLRLKYNSKFVKILTIPQAQNFLEKIKKDFE